MNNEEILMDEIKEKYSKYFEKEAEMVEKGKIITEEDANKYLFEFHKELFEYVEKRKKELNISTK